MESKKIKIDISPLNPLRFHSRFPHIVEKIFSYLDMKSLKKCREVSKAWQNSIDDPNLLWKKVVSKLGSNKAFQVACKNGLSKMVEMFLQQPGKFDFDINAKTWYNNATALEMACKNGHAHIAEILTKKSVEFNIDLSISNETFQDACENGYTKVVELLLQNPFEFGINVNAKTPSLAFEMACKNGHADIAEMITKKSVEFNIN